MVEYEVILDLQRLEIGVAMKIRDELASGEVRLEVPTWVPGDYAFSPYARDIINIQAKSTDSGESLEVTRDGFGAFIVKDCKGAMTVSYRAYGYEIDFGDACGMVDSDYAILLGTRYLHLSGDNGPCRVTYEGLRDGWKIHHPAGAQQDGDANCWTYPSYEILLDTPVVFGHFYLLRRDVKGTTFYFAFVDRCVGFEAEVDRFVDRVTDASGGCHTIFGEFPFENYTFIITTNPAADWGLEHLTSSMCSVGPDVFVDPDQFANGVRVCIHELFHAWNVRRLRPAPLGNLQNHLTDGSFSAGLWMAEGFTRYYEFLLGARAGVYTADQFFSDVLGYHDQLTWQPAYHRDSAANSSLTTYLNHGKYPGQVNNAIDYYDKGMLIAFQLDVELQTGPAKSSLDEAFSAFYKENVGVNTKPGYTTDDIVSFFNKISSGLGDSIGKAVLSPDGLKTISALESLGFKVERDERNYLGIVFLDDSEPTIYNLLDDSPAGTSGLAPGDVITRVNGFGYTTATLHWAARQSDRVSLDVTRGHRRLRFELDPGRRKCTTSLVWQGSAEQALRIKDWLGLESFDPAQSETLGLDFYENFHGVAHLI